jgi:pyruvate/2-oxoglutarate dehydrogenase complex dihydrolipoamide acyltransferase (E2) component
MAVLQQIAVPLLAVNDTFLTVVEINFSNKSAVQKGDVVMVFETSKTTYEVIADAEGYIQLMCEVGNDYAVNDIVAMIYSSEAEIVDEVTIKTDTVEVKPVASNISKAAFNYTELHFFLMLLRVYCKNKK